LGIIHHPHYEKHVPSFCKRYAKLGTEIDEALVAFKTEVQQGVFPSDAYSPYKMSIDEEKKFLSLMEIDEIQRMAEAEVMSKKIRESDEYEITKLY
jgi:3-methyl-2-oxobutanoate hydroxymethyltransferase